MIYKTQLNEEITGDGSTTLYRADLNETYHSRHGAITESRHIFLNHGFLAIHAVIILGSNHRLLYV